MIKAIINYKPIKVIKVEAPNQRSDCKRAREKCGGIKEMLQNLILAETKHFFTV